MLLSRVSSLVLILLGINFNFAMEINSACKESTLICEHRAAFKNPNYFEVKSTGATAYASIQYAIISKKLLSDKFESFDLSLLADRRVTDLNSEQMIALRDMFINPNEYIISKEEYIKKFDDNFYKQRVGRRFRGSSESFAYKSYTSSINNIIQRINHFVNRGIIVIPVKVNDLVVEIGEIPYTNNRTIKIEKVTGLVNNSDIGNDWANFIGLDDGMYHHRSFYRLLISSAQGVSTGDRVIINSTNISTKVAGITEDFRFLLADGRFYKRNQITLRNE